ncbi:hypothetical protein PQZ60_gp02 [Klebsiella phage vB_KpnM_FZ14]|uniref:hypothetical protein n=1 Tax=Klebsiella phage vB_KpnM_FZ14 TaxID=2530028 RepID=UPI00233EF676|nr:hypothetical protein PQZ60_gp02 [Klebsiella phage vB_KpnM_FZ14]
MILIFVRVSTYVSGWYSYLSPCFSLARSSISETDFRLFIFLIFFAHSGQLLPLV